MSASFAARVGELSADDDLDNSNPINGVDAAPDLPVAEAVARLKGEHAALGGWGTDAALYLARRHVTRLGQRGELAPLLHDEAVALHLHTQVGAAAPPHACRRCVVVWVNLDEGGIPSRPLPGGYTHAPAPHGRSRRSTAG